MKGWRGKRLLRYWRQGPGYDRNLSWERTVLAAIDYLHENPVRRGLVKFARQRMWSSVRWYASDGTEIDPHLPINRGLPPEFFA